MNKPSIIIEARTSSRRLPRKTLMKICGLSTIELMIERVKRVKNINKIILATTNKKCDIELVEIAKKQGIDFFCGSENDVLSRVLKAAQKFSVDVIISLQGDSVLIDPKCVDEALSFFLNNKFDYVSSALSNTFPIGMETQVFKRSVLEKVAKLTKNPVDREHVTLFIYKNPQIFKISGIKALKKFRRPELNLVLDEKKDFELIKIIFENLYFSNPSFSLSDIIFFLDNNPHLKNINSMVTRTNF